MLKARLSSEDNWPSQKRSGINWGWARALPDGES